jgi:hypothetical protein
LVFQLFDNQYYSCDYFFFEDHCCDKKLVLNHHNIKMNQNLKKRKYIMMIHNDSIEINQKRPKREPV